MDAGHVADEDRRDIAASLEGDEAAYARLVERYQSLIAAQMRRFGRNPAQTEELVQEVFVEVYFSLANFKGKAPFLHWIRRIATRVGYRHWKRQSREQEKREQLYERKGELPRPPDAPDPSEAAEFLYGLLDRLPPEDRVVLTLLYFEELDTREIARHMGWSRTLVKVRAYRARQKLRTMLEEAGFGSEADE